MIGIYFLFALVSVFLYVLLRRVNVVARIGISAAMFIVLCGIFTLIMKTINDHALPGSSIITPKMLQNHKQS